MIILAILKMIPTKSTHALVHYVLDGKAHNNTFTNNRNLYVGGNNIFGDYQNRVNSNYIDSQFYAVRKVASKSKKKTQGFHAIVSFSDNDFPPTKNTKTLQKQAKQAYQLVGGLIKKQLPDDAQYLIGIQRDGEGGKLHAHIAINSVLINGKTLDTNDLSLVRKITVKQKNKKRTKTVSKGFYDKMQDYFANVFEKLTGRKYERIERHTDNIVNSKAQQIDNRGGYIWKEDLKDRIVKSVQSSDSLDNFKDTLKNVYGVAVKEYQSSTGKIDAQGKKIKRLAYTYSFKDDNGKLHKSRDFHMTKKGAVRGLGKFTRPQDLEQVLEQNLEQEQQEELNQLQEIKPQIENLEVLNNDIKSKKSTIKQQHKRQQNDPEPTYKGTVRAVKQIKITKTDSEENNTDYTSYDKQTAELEQQNLQEINRRQLQHNAEVERERKEREFKRKKRENRLKQSNRGELKPINRHSERSNDHQEQRKPNPKPATNTRHISRDDEPDFE